MGPSLCCSSCHEDLIRGPASCLAAARSGASLSTARHLYKFRVSCYAIRATNPLSMDTKPRQKVFTLNAIVDGHIIRGEVCFSPAPDPGIMTEVARFEAERLLAQMVREEIAGGSL
jgi:hypothetical protein